MLVCNFGRRAGSVFARTTAAMEGAAVDTDEQSPSAKARSIPELRSDGSTTSAGANRRRERPPLRYTEDFATPNAVSLEVIGVVRSPYKERFGTPRQPNVTQHTLGNEEQSATIELYADKKFDLALRGLADFEYCWCITFFHLNQGWNPLVRPPRGPRKKQGVFATRSPHHPNPIGLSCLRITGVDEARRIVRVRGVDLLDGTAVLDIKPYVSYCDAFPNARAGWLDKLDQDMKAPDALSYYPPPAHLMRPITPPTDPEQTALQHEESENTE